jgi:hypothetical protein
MTTNVDSSDIKAILTYEKMKKDGMAVTKQPQSVTTNTTDTESPISQFNRIKREIDLIEKDIQFYQKNVRSILTL